MDSAITAMDKCYEWLPAYNIPYSGLDSYLAYIYVTTKTADGVEKGIKLYNEIIDQILLENAYYRKFTGKKASYVSSELSRNINLLNEINYRCQYLTMLLDENLAKMLDPVIEKTAVYGANNTNQMQMYD